MDVIDLTLILKSLGFRLDSIDFKEVNSHLIVDSERLTPDKFDPNAISVTILCGKSKLESRLSYKFTNTDEMIEKRSVCTCPKKETNMDNSFWEVQSSGSFMNHRRPSLNAQQV